MNEFLIKLQALFTGTGFSDAEAGLKRVKAAADEAAKATTKATTAPNASPAQPGKMFSPQESKDLARSIMAEAIEKAEAAENALRKVEDQANQTKAALQGGGASGGSGGGIIGWIGRVGAALAVGIGLGKAASSQIEKTGESVKRYLEIAKDFGQAQRDMANASSFDQIVAGLQRTDAAILEAKKNLEAYRKDWGSWIYDMLNGGKFSQAMADSIRGMEVKQFSGGLEGAKRNLEAQRQIAAVADDPAAVERIRRDKRRQEEVTSLQERIDKAPSWSPTAISEGKQQMQALVASYAAEDDALAKINARKEEAMRLEVQIDKAKNDGNQAEFERLQWIKEYNAALDRAKAVGMKDADAFAREAANSKMPNKAKEFERDMEKARQEALAREETARKKALAAEKAAAKEAADAKVEEAQRASRLQDMELEGKLAASRPGQEQRKLQWLRDYKAALSQLTDGLDPELDQKEWKAAANAAKEIADNLARAASNQDKLNSSASAESPDNTRGGAGRIAAERARAEERAQRLEGFGAYGAAESVRKRAYERAERESAKELDRMEDRSAPPEDKRGDLERDRDARYAADQAKRRKGLGEGLMDGKLPPAHDQAPAVDAATASADKAVENVANARIDASASALSNAASALERAAAALHDVGRYAD